jgi:hypothetical protein
VRPKLVLALKDALLEYDIVDLELDGEYAGTMQVRSSLMLELAKAVRRSEMFHIDIEDRR